MKCPKWANLWRQSRSVGLRIRMGIDYKRAEEIFQKWIMIMVVQCYKFTKIYCKQANFMVYSVPGS